MRHIASVGIAVSWSSLTQVRLHPGGGIFLIKSFSLGLVHGLVLLVGVLLLERLGAFVHFWQFEFIMS